MYMWSSIRIGNNRPSYGRAAAVRRSVVPSRVMEALEKGPRFDPTRTRVNRAALPTFLEHHFDGSSVHTYISDSASTPLKSISARSQGVPPMAEHVLRGLYDPDAPIFKDQTGGVKLLEAEQATSRTNSWLAVAVGSKRGEVDIFLAVREADADHNTVFHIQTHYPVSTLGGKEIYWGAAGTVLRIVARDYVHVQAGARKYEQLARDHMTGLIIRAPGEVRLRDMFEESRKSQQPVAMLYVDVNGLKAVNDNAILGNHEAGDAMISEVGRAIRESFPREDDAKVRWGGDEFVVILPGVKSIQEAEALARRLTEKSNTKVSVGIAFYDGRENLSFNDFVRRADQAMYRAKGQSRIPGTTERTSVVSV